MECCSWPWLNGLIECTKLVLDSWCHGNLFIQPQRRHTFWRHSSLSRWWHQGDTKVSFLITCVLIRVLIWKDAFVHMVPRWLLGRCLLQGGVGLDCERSRAPFGVSHVAIWAECHLFSRLWGKRFFLQNHLDPLIFKSVKIATESFILLMKDLDLILTLWEALTRLDDSVLNVLYGLCLISKYARKHLLFGMAHDVSKLKFSILS